MAKHIFYIGVVAALLVISHLFVGYPDGHSTHYNEPWLQAFSAQFQAGDLLPRWLVDYPQGLGAPVFYIYSLTPFYLGSVIDLACGGCETRRVLSILHFALFFLSGISFYFWGRVLAAPKWALLGALVYMLLPYHFLDIEWRNAIGEASTYIAMPLILLGIARAAKSDRFPVLGSCAYALMVLSHVPSALIFSIMIALIALGIYGQAGFGRAQIHAAVVTTVQIGFVGVLLAGFYLVPALLLQDYLLPGGWLAASGAGYLPETWVLPYGLFRSLFGVIVYGAFLSACLLGLVAGGDMWWQARRDDAVSHETLPMACALALVFCLFFVSPLSLPAWIYVEPLRMVQFPWRFGIIVDIACASLCVMWLARSAEPSRQRLKNWLIAGVFGGLIAGVGLLTVATYRDSENRRELRAERTIARHVLPPEYRTKWALDGSVQSRAVPNGFTNPQDYDRAFMTWLDYANALEEIGAERPLAAGESVAIQRTGPVQFEITATLVAPATVRIKQNWWPHWQLVDQSTGAVVETYAEAAAGFVAFDLPAGVYNLQLHEKSLRQEIWGWAVSGFGLVLLLLGYLFKRRKIPGSD
ncbi:MAG: hypothetical protein ACPG1C_14575 [Alphaproteobacteria bacterium]